MHDGNSQFSKAKWMEIHSKKTKSGLTMLVPTNLNSDVVRYNTALVALVSKPPVVCLSFFSYACIAYLRSSIFSRITSVTSLYSETTSMTCLSRESSGDFMVPHYTHIHTHPTVLPSVSLPILPQCGHDFHVCWCHWLAMCVWTGD